MGNEHIFISNVRGLNARVCRCSMIQIHETKMADVPFQKKKMADVPVAVANEMRDWLDNVAEACRQSFKAGLRFDDLHRWLGVLWNEREQLQDV